MGLVSNIGKEFDRIGGQISKTTEDAIRNTGNFYERNQNHFATVNSIVSGLLGPVTFGITPVVGQAINAGLAERNAVVNKRKAQQNAAGYAYEVALAEKKQSVQTTQLVRATGPSYGAGSKAGSQGQTGVNSNASNVPSGPPTVGQVVTTGKIPIVIVVAALILLTLNDVVTNRKK